MTSRWRQASHVSRSGWARWFTWCFRRRCITKLRITASDGSAGDAADVAADRLTRLSAGARRDFFRQRRAEVHRLRSQYYYYIRKFILSFIRAAYQYMVCKTRSAGSSIAVEEAGGGADEPGVGKRKRFLLESLHTGRSNLATFQLIHSLETLESSVYTPWQLHANNPPIYQTSE